MYAVYKNRSDDFKKHFGTLVTHPDDIHECTLSVEIVPDGETESLIINTMDVLYYCYDVDTIKRKEPDLFR